MKDEFLSRCTRDVWGFDPEYIKGKRRPPLAGNRQKKPNPFTQLIRWFRMKIGG